MSGKMSVAPSGEKFKNEQIFSTQQMFPFKNVEQLGNWINFNKQKKILLFN